MCCKKEQIEKLACFGAAIITAGIWFCFGRATGFKSAAKNVRGNIQTFIFPKMSEASVKEFCDAWNALCR